MALSIHTNYAALVTQNGLNKTNNDLAVTQQRLGTGLRVNSAADDAAGLQIATRLNAQTRGMAVASRNAQDAISMMQTAEGALDEATNIALRMKDLATQAANTGVNGDNEYTALDAEYQQLAEELGNILDNTSYGSDVKLLASDGKFSAAVTFQIGATVDETMSVDVNAEIAALHAVAYGTLDEAGASAEITVVEGLLDNLGSARAAFGANINRLNHTINNLSNMRANTETASGRIMDADFAVESANLSKNSMLMQSGISMLKQASQMPSMVMGLLG